MANDLILVREELRNVHGSCSVVRILKCRILQTDLHVDWAIYRISRENLGKH